MKSESPALRISLSLIGGVCLHVAIAVSGFIPSVALADTLSRPDGSEIVFHIDQSGQERQPIMLVLQGSGCEPIINRAWLKAEPRVLAPEAAILSIEKFGVTPGVFATPVDGCSVDYWRRNTLQQRVFDALQVIAFLRRAPWWNGKLIIYGGSEGGAIAAMLAPLVPETRAVIIYSSGIGLPVSDLISSAVPPKVAAKIPKIIAAAKANPTGDKRFGGASYRWWADAADVIPAKALLRATVPVLLVQGTHDRFSPVLAARTTRDLFATHGQRNLTYWEFEGLDHSMKDDSGGDHQPSVLQSMADWLRSQGN